MNAIATFFDDRENLVDSRLAAVVDFESTASPKPAKDNREDDAVEQRPITGIKRTVDEDVRVVIGEAAICASRHELRARPCGFRSGMQTSDASSAAKS